MKQVAYEIHLWKVTFKDGGTTIGTGTLSSGQATLTTSALTPGSHSITAVYGGDTNFTATVNNKDGYTVGAGLEYMFAPNWSAKAEYQYYNFGNTTFTAPAAVAGTRFRDDEHTVKVGVNYYFNSPAPVVTRY